MSRFGTRLRAGTLLSGWLDGGGASIKSVQAGTIAITGATSNTATVTAVVPSNSVLIHLGQTYATSVEYDKAFVRLALTNATTITATVNTSPGANTTTVSYVLVEFVTGVLKSVQRGTVTGATTATISTVNTNRAFLAPLGFTTDSGAGDTAQLPYLTLTNATTVTHSGTSIANEVSGYQVVEMF